MATAFSQNTRIAGSCFVLFCVSLFLASYSAKNKEIATVGNTIVSEFTTPVQNASLGLHNSFSGVWDSYLALVGVQQENEKLHQRLQALEAENSRLLEFQSENKRLRGLLGIIESAELKGIAASVIGSNPSPWVQSLTLDVGTSNGVQRGMAVIEAQGVVGKIINASRNSSEVLLITDHASGVDAIIQRTRARGVIEGSGRRLCRLRYVLKEEELRIGDRIISSGADGIFPKGLLIGVVSELDREKRGLFQALEVAPTVDFSRLENVLVLTDSDRAAIDVGNVTQGER